MDDDISTATHCDRDGDLWRVTASGADIWSKHQHRWIEARTILNVIHAAHGPDWLIRVVPGSARHTPTKEP